MASIVWGRNPQEAFRNPYEHEVNMDFSVEARTLLESFLKDLMKKNLVFTKQDTSLAKAEWMLLTDSVDGLIEALELLDNKRHRVSARIFRDVLENLDLVSLFRSDTDKSKQYRMRWFEGEFISHSTSRAFLKETMGEEARKNSADYYKVLSQFTHRTYNALCDSYVIGKGEKIAYDTHTIDSLSNPRILVLPQTTSAYYTVIADLTIVLSKSLIQSELISNEIISQYWNKILETPQTPRRFIERT